MKKICWLMAVVILLLGAGEMLGVEKKASFPQGPINYLIGFAPGGKTDTQARTILPYVEKYLGVRVVIQNFPGAGGRIGYTKLFKAKPDGYTIGNLPLPAVILGEYLAPVDYRTTEFTPIHACFVGPQILVVAENTYKSLDELIKAGKSKSLTNSTPGTGTSPHLAALVMANGLGLKDVKHVHFDSAAALAALAGKHVDFSVAITTNALPLVRAGRLKPLLVIADERDKAFPQVPIPKELGYKIPAIPGIDGVAGPPNLPLEKVKILERAFAKAAADPEFLNRAERAGMSIIPMDHAKYRQVVEDYTLKESMCRGYSLALFSIEDNVTNQIMEAFLGKRVDGLLLDTNAAADTNLMRQIDTLNVPHIIIHPNYKNNPSKSSYIQINNKVGAKQAIDYLIELGHRSIGIISYESGLHQELDRLGGYQQALAEAGIRFRPEWVFEGSELPFQVGVKGALNLIPKNKDLTAIFAGTDEIAMGTLSAIWQLGLRIPYDISVIGFDDISYASMIAPPLTTIHQPIDEIARIAVEHLIEMIDDPEIRPIDLTLPTKLVIRESCRSLIVAEHSLSN